MKKITIVQVDDWEVLYGPDGEKITEDHNIRGELMFGALKQIDAHPKDLELEYEDLSYEEAPFWEDLFNGTSPERLSIIREYKLKK